MPMTDEQYQELLKRFPPPPSALPKIQAGANVKDAALEVLGEVFGETETVMLHRCQNCGQTYPEHVKDDPERCRCRRAASRGRETLDTLDPTGRMTLENMIEPDATITKAGLAALGIVKGERRKGLLLIGPPGRGKTHLMVGMLRRMVEKNRVVAFKNIVKLVTEVRATYNNGTTLDRATVISNLAVHEIVMLDDLGKERKSEDTDGILYELIDELYMGRKTLIASTNLTTRQLHQRYDEAVISRLEEMCGWYIIEGRDRREEVTYD